MKVLCAAQPIIGHTLPMLALGRAFLEHGHEVQCIQYGDHVKALIEQAGIQTHYCIEPRANITRRFAATLDILDDYRPDITICDWRFDFWLGLRRLKPGCTISIVRCEQFLDYRQLSQNIPDKFNHTAVDELNSLLNTTEDSVKDRRELQVADIMVIPGIPSMDPAPAYGVYERSDFIYTGATDLPAGRPLSANMVAWFTAQRRDKRDIILVTLGAVVGENIHTQLAAYLSQSKLAVVMIVPDKSVSDGLSPYSNQRFLIQPFSQSLSALLQGCDVVVHHCGHGTFQQVLLAEKPSVTISTMESDREDNAIRLQRLGCSRHLDRDTLAEGFDLELLVREIKSDQPMKQNIKSIASEIRWRMQNSGVNHVVRHAESKIISTARIIKEQD